MLEANSGKGRDIEQSTGKKLQVFLLIEFEFTAHEL